ncbi:MAG: DUF167 domain-containing protein [Planctomycetota bacterium]
MTVYRETANGLEITVRLKPRSSRNEVLEERNGALVCAVHSPPVDGKANEALIELLAEWLDVPRKALEITAGLASRDKKVSVAGTFAAKAKEKLT